MKWAESNGYKGSFSEICKLEGLKEYILKELAAVAQKNKVRSSIHSDRLIGWIKYFIMSHLKLSLVIFVLVSCICIRKEKSKYLSSVDFLRFTLSLHFWVFHMVTSLCSTNQLRGFEYIKGIVLDPIPFDIERDLVTATMKKRRNNMLKYYQVRQTRLSIFSSSCWFWVILIRCSICAVRDQYSIQKAGNTEECCQS